MEFLNFRKIKGLVKAHKKRVSISKAAKRLDRLYHERGCYLQAAEELITEGKALERNDPKRKELFDTAQTYLGWSVSLQPEIDQASKQMETAINSAGLV